jgi:hypothetical protein
MMDYQTNDQTTYDFSFPAILVLREYVFHNECYFAHVVHTTYDNL